MTHIKTGFWSRIFLAAALFNFAIGIPIFFFPVWSYGLAYHTENPEVASTYRFWSDFGFTVIAIGIGYFLVSLDVTKNRGIVWLGIIGKLFDVLVLSYRYIIGIACLTVLFPAIVDGIFVVLFLLFLFRKTPGNSTRVKNTLNP
ncbi:MAG TPA: hypothetical protein DIW47_00905 [Bacteroidetes bacterium]|nr:hypothetical protein [Marinilabiliales bacterium]HCS19119.1 hypothetical protein [Bacteroidota bacterium]